MSLTPLFSAPLPIILHALVALFLCILTIALFTFKRGAKMHRILGWIWVICMGFVALSSFWISELKVFGAFSPIHGISLWTLIALVLNVTAARRHNVKVHRRGMKSLVFGALIVAGVFTLLPGRIMFEVITGG